VVVMLASLLASTLLGLVVGAQWAAAVSGVLVTMVVVPVAGGAMYYGWRQVIADRLPGTPPALPEDTGSGFHAWPRAPARRPSRAGATFRGRRPDREQGKKDDSCCSGIGRRRLAEEGNQPWPGQSRRGVRGC